MVDKFALSTQIGTTELSHKIIEIIRPDIINEHQIRYAVKEIKNNLSSTTEKIPVADLQFGSKVHKTLPLYLVVSTHLLALIFKDIGLGDTKLWLDNFARDWDYTQEFIYWHIVACSYINFLEETRNSFDNLEFRKRTMEFLIRLGISDFNYKSNNEISEKNHKLLLNIYYRHLEYFKQFYDLNDNHGIEIEIFCLQRN